MDGKTTMKVETRLPCGGRIELCFYKAAPAKGIDKIAIVCLPEVYCPGSYAKAHRCAWTERLRKVYASAGALDERRVHGDANAGVTEAEVDYGDGKIRHVRYGEDSGIVVCGCDIFQDSQLRVASFEERNDAFECGNEVKAEHGGIIAFMRRIFCNGGGALATDEEARK